MKEASQIQNFRIFEWDFISNFEVYKSWLKTFKKALSQVNLYGERELF
jgi:hypothetical protein